MNCSKNKIFNPKSKRCVKKDGVVGKKILLDNKGVEHKIKCDDDQIFNTKTERCVKKYGKSAKDFLGSKYNPKPTHDKKKKEERQLVVYKKKKEGNCLERSKVPLKDYQKKVARFMQTNDELLVVHQTGTGKTLSAVTTSQCYLDKDPKNKVLVITPTSVVTNFHKELRKYGVTDTSRYVVVSYNIFRKYYFPSKRNHDFDTFIHKKSNTFKPKITKKQIEESKKRFPTENFMLIIDEAHNTRNYTSDLAVKMLYKAHEANKRVLLTATPFVNNLSDLGSLSNILHGEILFNKKTLNSKSKSNGVNFVKLSVSLQNKVDVLETSEDNSIFPEKKVKFEDISMTEESYKQMIENVKESTVEFGGADPFYINLKIQTNLFDEDTDKAKAKRVYNLIKNKSQNVIYSNLLNDGVGILIKYFDKKNKKHEIVSGSLSKKKRQDIFDRFNRGEIDTLIITDAAREGVDLKGVRNMILLNPPWSDAILNQIVGRAVRYKSHLHYPPSERFVNIYYIRAVPPNAIYKEQKKLLDYKGISTCSKFNKNHINESLTSDQCLYDIIISRKQQKTEEVMEFLYSVNI